MGKIITVCGGHGSGKTTVAANLGYMLAQNSLVGILSTNMVCGIIQHLFEQLLKIAAVCMKSLYQNTIMQSLFVPCPNNKKICF